MKQQRNYKYKKKGLKVQGLNGTKAQNLLSIIGD